MSTVGFFNQYRIWGGGEKWHYTAAIYAADRGEKVVVFTPFDGELWKRLSLEKQIKLVHISINKYSYFNPLSLFRFYLLFKKHKLYSIVFNSQTDVRSAALPAKWANVKKIFFRAGSPQILPNKKSYQRSLRALSHLVSISEAIKNNFQEHCSEVIKGVDLEIVISNAIDFDEYKNIPAQKIYEAKASEVILGHAGRFSSEKGQHFLIQVAKQLKDQGVAFQLLLAGKGETEEDLKSEAKSLGLSNNIQFVGFLENVKDLLTNIDICLFPSLFEGTSSFLIETMAMSKPIVCFNISSMPEMVNDSESGFMVPMGDINLFTRRVKQLIGDKKLRDQFGRTGYVIAQEKFNAKKNYARWLDLLTDPR